jgi:tripartite-type tricarboxylate transporter receptor subunit TctC
MRFLLLSVLLCMPHAHAFPLAGKPVRIVVAGYDVGMWGYLWFWGPAGMAPDTLDALHRHLARAVEHPEVKDLFAKGGSEAMALPPAEMMRVSRDLHDRWGTIIRELGVKLD